MPDTVIKVHFESIDSTHAWMKRARTIFGTESRVRLTANGQTAGHGRFKRRWVSPPGVNIYVTYFFTVRKNPLLFPQLARKLCLIISAALEGYGLTPCIKEPNDVLIKEKKIAGVLAEVVDPGGKNDERNGLILSMGINVNMSQYTVRSLSQSIGREITSILAEGVTVDRKELLRHLDDLMLEHFCAPGKPNP
ncbi:MAG: biotin--[acetyl-CoA-carboxylase] ligase [Simkaniaceae bacterium]|nr:biotin--[acetyl-CoA-carboxylase] ligase [Simkaniaceae bacterium]